jgi:hypothetical protein
VDAGQHNLVMAAGQYVTKCFACGWLLISASETPDCDTNAGGCVHAPITQVAVCVVHALYTRAKSGSHALAKLLGANWSPWHHLSQAQCHTCTHLAHCTICTAQQGCL